MIEEKSHQYTDDDYMWNFLDGHFIPAYVNAATDFFKRKPNATNFVVNFYDETEGMVRIVFSSKPFPEGIDPRAFQVTYLAIATDGKLIRTIVKE